MKRVLIFYSHFYPAYKAGGPVQSLINLVEVLREDFNIFIVCSARDMGDTTPLKGIEPNAWNQFGKNVKVFYVQDSIIKAARSAFKTANPDIIYINGLYLAGYNWLPLWLARWQNRKVIMASRGMLQKGALAIKPFKKKCFLFAFKLFGFHRNVIWHATDTQEQEDSRRVFGNNVNVIVASNIPKRPKPNVAERSKKTKGRLRMIYLSLITEKKNLHLIFEALRKIKTPIEFDIYGPVKDKNYWKKCKQLMESQVHKIRYLGVLNPLQVQDTLASYDAFILPTKGENFGHAIYEALSVGTPVLISPFTPWGRVQDFNAGITTELDVKALTTAIETFIEYDGIEFSMISSEAHKLAVDYFEKNDFQKDYQLLFS